MEEINLKNGILTYKRKLKKSETYKFLKGKKFETLSIFKKPTSVNGISSYCESGKHCLFIDYDLVPKWLVEQDYVALQNEYSLPPAYLLTTKEEEDEEGETFGNYHIICLATFYPNEVYKMLSKTHADINYFSMPIRNKYRNWILRISNKSKRERPIFLRILGEIKNLDKEISSAHLDFLNKVYDLPKIDYTNKTGKGVFLQSYETLNT